MRRADRLFQIIQILRRGKLVTAGDLADRLEVSPRTIYRDIADLIGAGVPVEGAAGLGYLMRPGYDLPPLMFSTEEVVALVAGARLLRAWGGAEMALAAEGALGKIEAVLPQAARARAGAVHIHAIVPGDTGAGITARLDRLEAACNGRERLRISYEDAQGARSRRDIRPLGLIFWGRAWTLAAWCELRRDFRVFRLDRIGAVEALGPFPAEADKSLARFYALKARPC